MKRVNQTWIFEKPPVIISSATVGGPFEAKGAISKDFDMLHTDNWLGQDSFEKAEKKLLENACEIVIKKANLKKEDINFFISGDLLDQIITSTFTARTLKIPFLGIYGACSSSMEGLALAALLVDSNAADIVLAAATSHYNTAEKQYRYPNDYGSQKPPTAQWTVTGSGAVIVSNKGEGIKVTSATIGRVIDMGITDPSNMGAAMAPAAVDTIKAHFKDLNIAPDYYDIIATGDLGVGGHKIAKDLLAKDGINISEDIFTDCGLLIYGQDQQVFSGGSGCACSATVTYGHFFNRMKRGEIKRILIIATGALLSPLSSQQKESIPSIAHAVSMEI
ncbi:MAG TPA: stage V sporulation protein AD [Clostridiaceae bacterium]